jgi:hypothetical protein
MAVTGESFLITLGRLNRLKNGLAAVAISGSYADLSDKPVNVSEFNNDAGYVDAAGAVAAAQLKKEIVETLPEADVADGNTIYLTHNGADGKDVYDEYMLIDGVLERIGSTATTLANVKNLAYLDTVDAAQIDDLAVTTAKLAGDIPIGKLDENVQASLARADSAFQESDLATDADIDALFDE